MNSYPSDLARRISVIERYLAQAHAIALSRGDSMPPLPAGWEADAEMSGL